MRFSPPPEVLQSAADAAHPGSPRMLVSILNWNGLEDTLNCLSRFRSAENLFSFVVLDNGSHSDPSSAIGREFPFVEVVRVPENLGFTGGHNVIMKLAIARGYESVLLLNNDCLIEAESILQMQLLLDRNPHVAAVSPLIYADQEKTHPQAVSGWLDWRQHVCRRPSQPNVAPNEDYPLHIVGTALLLRIAALREIGLLNDSYFAYYEDNDLSARIAKSGYTAMYCETATAIHPHRRIDEYSALSFYLSARNAWLFWTTHTPRDARNGLARHLLAQHLMEIALLKKNSADKAKMFAVVDGFWDAQLQRFGPPPTNRTSPWLIRWIAIAAPFALSEFISSPLDALLRRLGVRSV